MTSGELLCTKEIFLLVCLICKLLSLLKCLPVAQQDKVPVRDGSSGSDCNGSDTATSVLS